MITSCLTLIHLAEKLDADWELFERGGHFMAQDGFTEFPALYDVMIRMREQAT